MWNNSITFPYQRKNTQHSSGHCSINLILFTSHYILSGVNSKKKFWYRLHSGDFDLLDVLHISSSRTERFSLKCYDIYRWNNRRQNRRKRSISRKNLKKMNSEDLQTNSHKSFWPFTIMILIGICVLLMIILSLAWRFASS